ncbi:MAG: Gfo/Idh/MocA family oxidoreductase [Elusimicrobia bacterium]|nr:Gfo/Idh/MocA family oxidoreductase [Elusimicrobiota bacterium]
MKNIAIIGCGYWGKNLVRNFYKLGVLNTVCDSDDNLLNKLKENYPDIKCEKNFNKILSDKNIAGVVISTPASSHYELVKKSLENGKNVLVEKPFTTSVKEAEELVKLAKNKKLILMVGFTFLYNAAVIKVKEIIDSGELGDIYYVCSQRLNLGIVRKDVNAWWNLAPHDVSIILYWISQKVKFVSGFGISFLQKGIEDVVTANIKFDNLPAAFIHVSWLNPSKVRQMAVIGSKKMAIYDDVSTDRKVQVYDKGVDKFEDFNSFDQFQLIHRAGDVYVPKIDFKEPLEIEAKHFVDCIKNKKQPFTSGEKSLPVVNVLEGVEKSIKQGKTINL